MNGKPGDHPLTDVLTHRLPVFSPEDDRLIIELDDLGAWEGELVSFLMRGLHDDVRRLREAGGKEGADTLLHNFAGVLRDEKEQLRLKGT